MILGSLTKQPQETYPIFVDFTRRLQTGETVNGKSVTSINLASGASSTTDLLQSDVINGNKIEVRLKAGQPAPEDHRVQFRATTSLGNIYEDEVDIRIRES